MIISNLNPYADTVNGKVELYTGSTLSQVCTCEDVLQDFTIERIGDNTKFFGYGVCHKAHINLIDIERTINISTDNSIKVYFGVEDEFISPYPTFYVTEVNRDENTNTISITAYDLLYWANQYTFADLGLENGYLLVDVAIAAAFKLGASDSLPVGMTEEELVACFALEYPDGANFSGAEGLRSVLNAIAEATQTIYYIGNQEELVFKRLDMRGEAVETITRDYYYLLDSKTNRRLSAVCHATELGDNVTASLDIPGTTQYVRNNPFWDLREDIAELVNNALVAVGGLTINQFSMNWSGNFLLELGDKIALVLEDESIVETYLLNDVVRYMGCIDETTEFNFEDNESETASNPSTLGEAIKQTFARVDKANKRIELVASETETNKTNISQLQINTSTISGSVERVEQVVTDGLESVNEDLETITTRVNATMSSQEINIAIQNEVAKGTTQVATVENNFTFNDEGLRISKSDSDMTTQITEDGMSIYRGAVSEENKVLIADNKGVKAENLHATTYLIIDSTSRFEDWEKDGEKRTACFWIGG